MKQPKVKKNAARNAEVLAQIDSLPDDARIHEVIVSRLLGTSAATTWRHARAGLIPPPTRTGPRATTWRLGDIRQHLASFKKVA